SGVPPEIHNENNFQWGGKHSGVCNFLMGDGSVRALSVTIPTGGLAANANSIMAKLGNVNDGNTVALP
ncbi:MAG: DUF1559 domain-containing protein, partial [Planctomycetaceae bacterium]|nr:DUF1559 domain-containing protein [Planctomycetaceae bacterium]